MADTYTDPAPNDPRAPRAGGPIPIDPDSFATAADPYEHESDERPDAREDAAAVDPRHHYTAAELAARLGPLVALGVENEEAAEAMAAEAAAGCEAVLGMAGAGRALAAWGVHKGPGRREIDLPPGVAIACAGIGCAVVGLNVRGKYGYPVQAPEGLKRAAARAGWRAVLSRLNPVRLFRRRRAGAEA